jgi:ketosteroid isomerase-like protein
MSGYESLEIHQTSDPEVLIAEFEVVGRMQSDGDEFRLPYVQRLRVRNGQIIEFRDYWPPQTTAVAALTVTAQS